MDSREQHVFKPEELRAGLRSHLRRAARGNQEAFKTLSEPYVYLLVEFLAARGFEDEQERLNKATELLRETWKFLPLFHRVADLERFLATSLFSVQRQERTGGDPLLRKLHDLDPRQTFALIARDFENWDYRNVAAALRVSRRELSEILVTTRCHLLDLDLNRLDVIAAACVRRLSLDLDGQTGAREKRRICRQVTTLPQVREFKSEWLELRCRLIEFRQQVRMEEEERAALLQTLAGRLEPAQMIQVPMLERFVNRLSMRPSFVPAP